eukprot:4253603-Alexandrium_andersonii.AAC.1
MCLPRGHGESRMLSDGELGIRRGLALPGCFWAPGSSVRGRHHFLRLQRFGRPAVEAPARTLHASN